MPRLNLYEMANPFRAPRSSGADFGAAPAQALEGFGDEALKIGERIQRREELDISNQVFGEFDTQALPVLNVVANNKGTLPEVLKQFDAGMQKLRSDALAKANLRPEARAALERQLDNQITQYHKLALSARIKAGHESMLARVNQQFSTGANQVDAAPHMWEDVAKMNEDFVKSQEPGMDPLTYQTAMKRARSGPIQAAVNAYVAQGLVDKADEILQRPEVNSLIDPDALRPLRIDVAVGKGKAEAETTRQNQNVQKFQMRLGRELTPEETLKARSLPAKKDMTPADEITELELVQGKPASQDQVDKIYKTYIDGGKSETMFGNSLQGRALSYVTDNAVAYANGLLTPDKARQFEASFNEAYGTKTYMDPVTGQPKPVTPSVPRFIQDAMDRGSSIYGGLTAGAAPRTGDNIRPPGETTTMFIDGKMIGSGVADASGRWSIPAPPEPGGAGAGRGSQGVPAPAPAAAAPTGGPRLWDQADNVAGPVAGVQRWIGSGPIPLGIGGEQVSAAQQVEMQSRNLVRALQQNPRYAEGERKSIEKDIQIDPEAMSNPTAYRLRLVEIGKYIQEELQFQASVLKNPNGSTVQQRQQALQSTATLNEFYSKLGLPQQVKSVEEAKKLPPGTQFLDENWILRQVPGGR